MKGLRSQVADWQASFAAMSDIVWLLDNRRRIVRCNKPGFDLGGKTCCHLIGRPCWEVVHGTKQPIADCPLKRMRKSGKRESIELSLGERVYQETVDPVFGAAGQLKGAVHILREITDQKHAETRLHELNETLEDRVARRTAELRANEALLQRVLNGSNDGYGEWDLTTGQVFVSARWREIIGLEGKGDLLRGEEVARLIHPDDLARVGASVMPIIEGRAGTDRYEQEMRYRRPDGRVVWVNTRATVTQRDAQGRALQISGLITDITTHKQTEQSSRDSEERYELATSVANEAIWDVDLVTGTTRWNRSYAEVFGRPVGAHHRGGWWLRRIHPEDRQRINASFTKALGDGSIFWAEKYRMKLADGSYAFLSDRAIIVRDANGHAVRVVGAKLDISAQHRAEEALRESEATARALVNNPVDSVMLLDRHGTIVDLNETAAQRLGFPKSELLGKRLFGVLPAPLARHRRRKLLAAFHTGCVMRSEEQRQGLWTDSVYSPILNERGHVARVAIVARDITQRKKAELAAGALAAIVQSSSDAITVISMDGLFTQWNRGAEHLYGFQAHEVLGRPISLIVPLDRAYEVPLFLKRLRRGELVISLETERLHKNGERLPVSLTISPVHDAKGRIIGSAAIARDIRERKQLEADVLRVSEQERQRFGQDLHDSLGQHLAALKFQASSLYRKFARRKVPGARNVERFGRELGKALEETRAIARGLQPVQPHGESLASALHELAENVSRLFGIHCHFDCRRAVVHDHYAATQLYRIAQEAVGNAARHARPKHIYIKLIGLNANGVQLRVEDDGRGLPPPSRRRTGLGLGIMHHRASVLGATLTVGARRGGGTRVVCSWKSRRLPAEKEPLSHERQAQD